MRIGVAYEASPNANYRAIDPLNAMVKRGHEIVGPPDARGELDVRRLRGCDVVHIYRRASDQVRRGLSDLVAAGVPIVYDNDDDLSELPRESPKYKSHGGLQAQRIFGMTVKAARMAKVVTTTTEPLADKYRRGGVERVEIVGNYINPSLDRTRKAHEGLVIGWVAGVEHQIDASQLGIRDMLQRILDKHSHVRIHSFGVNLGLGERYVHEKGVMLNDIPARMATWDIGLAPLIDIPCNRARSDIKVKEYAASGIAWLASPVGPYLGLGDKHGGQIVADDQWFDALDRLVTNDRLRNKLARKGSKWARRQTIDAGADQWERVFREAAAA